MSDGAGGGEAPGNVSGDNVATYTAPLFSVKRFAGMKEYVVPEAMYSKMRYGRESGSRWVNYVEDEALRNEVKETFHKDGKLLLTCDKTGRSVVIRKQRIRKMAAMPETD